MANRGHTIAIASDTRAFEQGVRKGVIDPLEDAQSTLEDLANDRSPMALSDSLDKAGDKADDLGQSDGPDKLERGLKDAEGASDKLGQSDGPDKLERQLRDAQDATDKLATEAGKAKGKLRDMGDGGHDATEKIKGGAEEVRDEFASNMSETFSSFRGDLSDIGQLGQDTLGGLAGSVAGMGPAGGAAAAGLGLVAGAVGVIQGAFEAAQEATDNAKESAFAYANEVGNAFSQVGYAERLSEWTSSTEKWQQALDIQKVSGLDLSDVLDALASGGDKLDALWDSFEKGANNTSVATKRGLELEGVLTGTKQGFEQGKAAAEANAAQLGRYADQAGKATGKTDGLGNSIKKLPDQTEVVVDALTGKAYADVDHFDKKVGGLKGKTVPIGADLGPFYAAVDRARRTGLRPIQMNVDATVVYRDRGGKVLQ